MALRADVECRVLTLWGVDKADLAVQHTSSLGRCNGHDCRSVSIPRNIELFRAEMFHNLGHST